MVATLAVGLLSFTSLLSSSALAEGLSVIADTGGHDQIDTGNGAQQDIAGVFNDGTTFGFAWDETDLSGNNSSDVCTYFQEGDGTVTAVCYSVQYEADGSITPGFPQYETLDCGTTYGNGKCTGNNPVSAEYAVTCTDPELVDPYFAEDSDQDLQAQCEIIGLGGNDASTLLYVNTCTKPSASPSSLSNDCIFDPGAPDPGFLQLVKVVSDGSAVPTDFVLTATSGLSTISGAGDTGLNTVLTGIYTITESSVLIDDGTYALESISCSTNGGAAVDESDGTVEVDELATTICTVTNKVAFIAAPALSIEKVQSGHVDVDGDGDVELGDTLEYTVTATNSGNVVLNNVVVTDDLTGESITCASVAVGETCVLNASHVVTSGDVAAGIVSNTATADSDETGPVDDTVVVPVAANPALAIEKVQSGHVDVDDDGDVELGDTLNYTVTATNTGDVVLNNVVVTDDLTGETITCASVAVGETCVLTASHIVTSDDVAAGIVSNTATADSDETDPVDDTVVVDVVANPAYVIDKSLSGNADEDGNGEVSLGDTLTYDVVVTNTGDITMDLSISDSLIDPATAVCPAVVPGDVCTLTGTYEVTQANVDAGTISNTATGTSNLLGPITDTVDVLVPQNPGLSVVKVLSGNADEDGNGEVSLGDTLSYTVTATNAGNTTLDITVEDGLTGGSTSCADTAPGGTCVLVTSYQVTQADVDAGNVSNTAVADSDQTGPVDDTVDVPVPQHPVVDLTKSGSLDLGADGIANPGDVITYSISATNTGNVTLTGVDVSDAGLTGLVCDTDTLAPGETTTCSGTHAITQADIDAGVYDNTAAVTTDQGAIDDDTHNEPIPQTPSVSVAKTPDEQVVQPGESAIFTITATNTGNVTLTNVSVSDPLAPSCDNTVGTLAPSESVTYDCTYSNVTGPFVNVATVAGTSPAGEDVTDSDDAAVYIPTAQIAPTATTCQTFRDGTSDDLDAFLYNLKRNKVNAVSPGVMFYYSTVTVNAGDTITVDQANDGGLPLFDVQKDQAFLWGEDCTKQAVGSVTDAGGTTTFTAPADGTYIIGIKYTPDSVKGKTNPGSVDYDFITSINGTSLISSGDTITLTKK